MKNQRMKTEARGFGVSKLAGILLMLVALVCCFTVLSSAAESTTVIRVNPNNVVFTNLQAEDGDTFTAVYGDNVTVALKTEANGSAADLANYTDYGFAAADKGKVYLTATLDTDISRLPVGEHTVNVTFALAYADGVNPADYEGKYGVSSATTLRYTVKILPRPITWSQGSGSVSVRFPYVMGQSTYTEALDTNAFGALQFSGVVNGDTVHVNSTATSATFYNVQKAGAAQTTVTVGIDNNNYVLTQPLTVNATVEQIRITQIHWEEYHFTWGDTVVITVLGEGNDGNQYELAVEYDPAYAAANGAVGDYTVKVKSPDAANITLEGLTTEHPYHINQKVFTNVTFESVNVIGDGRESYAPVVKGTDIPADILALIEYTESGKAFKGTSVYGVYTVSAKLPQSSNYIFKDKLKSKAYITDRARGGVKLATLKAETLKKREHKSRTYSLVKIGLFTGRFHQIRAQMSYRGAPVAGDKKYGGKDSEIKSPALLAYKLDIKLKTENISVLRLPDMTEYPWSLFDEGMKKQESDR